MKKTRSRSLGSQEFSKYLLHEKKMREMGMEGKEVLQDLKEKLNYFKGENESLIKKLHLEQEKNKKLAKVC